MDPKSAEAMVGVAAVLVEYVAVSWSKTPEQDKSRAEELLTAALAVNQNTTRLHFTLKSLLRRMQGRWAEARGEFEEELARDRNNAGAMLQLGFTLNNLGQPEAALPHLGRRFGCRRSARTSILFISASGPAICILAIWMLRSVSSAKRTLNSPDFLHAFVPGRGSRSARRY